MEYAIAVITGLFGVLFLYERNRRKGAEAINKNNDVLNEVKDLDREIKTNQEKLAEEAAKREKLEEDTDTSSKTLDELAKLLGRRE